MFGSSSSNSGSLFGDSNDSSSGSILPTFQDDSAFAKICPDLSYKQRIIGFLSCSGIGYVISFIGTLTLFNGFSPTNIRIFAVLYILGNIIALCATGFLLGPKAQCKKMWDPTRRFSTAFYLSMMIIVFAVAVTKQNIFLIIFLLIIQILAGAWYSLSYIPFGRKIVLQFLRSTGCCFPCFAVSDAFYDMINSKKSSSLSTSLSSSNTSKSATPTFSNIFGSKK